MDPLAAIWQVAEPRLRAAPELEAKALFEYLLMIRPEQMQATQLRTFQRRAVNDIYFSPSATTIIPRVASR